MPKYDLLLTSNKEVVVYFKKYMGIISGVKKHTEKTPYWCIYLSNLAFGRRKKNIWGTAFASGGTKKAIGGCKKKEPTFFFFLGT